MQSQSRAFPATPLLSLACVCVLACNAILGIGGEPEVVASGDGGASSSPDAGNVTCEATHSCPPGTDASASMSTDGSGAAEATLSTDDAGTVGSDATSIVPVRDAGPEPEAAPVTPCDGGACPTVIASSQQYPVGIAVDATNVYWADNGSGLVMRCALGGCNDNPTEITSSTSPIEVVADGTNVYFTDNYDDVIYKCAPGGCGSTPTSLANNLDGPYSLAVYAGNVYWTDILASTVSSCAVGGCGNAPTIIAKNQNNPHGIAVNSTGIYWVTLGSGGGTADGEVLQMRARWVLPEPHAARHGPERHRSHRGGRHERLLHDEREPRRNGDSEGVRHRRLRQRAHCPCGWT